MEDTADAVGSPLILSFIDSLRSTDAGRCDCFEGTQSGVDVDLVCERLKNGDGGNTALWFALKAPGGGIEVAKVLVDAGAEVNRQCEHGRTALHMAAAWGHLDLVKYLLEKSAAQAFETKKT
jgi:hypothetical protein